MRDDEDMATGARHTLGRQLNFAAKAARGYMEQHLAASGSSFAVWTALFALKAKGPLIQRELADMLGVEGPTLTRHLARMEAEGLIVRRRTSSDRRAAIVDMTDAGRQTFERLSAVVSTSGEHVLDGFSPEEIEQFAGYLSRVIGNVETFSPARRHTPAHS
ncbi:MarR family transcriptional regulator [Actinoallomurus sp. NPDC050550]|uniref:MarR family winged helix-turn-helix transcriptional regulator n=1 Tax=Actinoallomurus sp. NPDC050550 TaxID=3154937 RepID=UPI0033FA0463